MILVSEAGSMRAVAACEAITWPLVSSSSSHALADSSGAGNACAHAPDAKAEAASMATANFARPGRLAGKGLKDAPAGPAGSRPDHAAGNILIHRQHRLLCFACVSAGATRGAGI